MWSVVIIISATLAVSASNFETEDHCKIAMKQAAAFEGKAACIWTPKSGIAVTSAGALILGR